MRVIPERAILKYILIKFIISKAIFLVFGCAGGFDFGGRTISGVG
jgi:hypothetical protein